MDLTTKYTATSEHDRTSATHDYPCHATQWSLPTPELNNRAQQLWTRVVTQCRTCTRGTRAMALALNYNRKISFSYSQAQLALMRNVMVLVFDQSRVRPCHHQNQTGIPTVPASHAGGTSSAATTKSPEGTPGAHETSVVWVPFDPTPSYNGHHNVMTPSGLGGERIAATRGSGSPLRQR